VGDIISERWATSFRKGGRHHPGKVGGFVRIPHHGPRKGCSHRFFKSLAAPPSSIPFNVSRILPTLLNHHPTLDRVRELSRRANRLSPSTTANCLLDVILRDLAIECAALLVGNGQIWPENRQCDQGASVLRNPTPTAHFPGQGTGKVD